MNPHAILAAAQREDAGAAFDLAKHDRPFVTVKALASYLDCDRRTIVRMIASGSLPATRVGRAWRIATEDARVTFHVQRHLATS